MIYFIFTGISSWFCCLKSALGHSEWGLIRHDSYDVMYQQLPVFCAYHKNIDFLCMQSPLWAQMTLRIALCGLSLIPWVWSVLFPSTMFFCNCHCRGRGQQVVDAPAEKWYMSFRSPDFIGHMVISDIKRDEKYNLYECLGRHCEALLVFT